VPLLEALAYHLNLQRPDRLGTDLAGCAWLVRLLPELAGILEPLPSGNLAPDQERRLLYAAVGRFLANVAGPAGTVLILDDLQWAGPDALELLATLAGTSASLRIVSAYRDTEVRPADPLSVVLSDLAQARLRRQHTLGPLAQADAAALLHSLLAGVAGGDATIPGHVLERAGGMPFFLVSYAQALCTGAVEAVPWDLAQGVRQRVALLPATGQEILGAAAIVGRRVPRAVLVAVAGQPEEDVLSGLEAACRLRLLQEEGEEGYAFAHDVIREVVEADVGSARRAVLHRRVAEALKGDPTGAPPELLAYHHARSGTLDSAVPYLEQAGDRAWTARAHGAAEAHYQMALDHLERLGRTHDAVRVREKLGEVLIQIGRYDAALQVLEPAAIAYGAGDDREGLGRVTARVGEAHALRDTPEEGIARLQPLVERLEQGEAFPAQAALCLRLAVLMFMAGRYGESLTAVERAAELARAAGNDRVLVQATWNRANILQMLGRPEEALRADQEVLPVGACLENEVGWVVLS